MAEPTPGDGAIERERGRHERPELNRLEVMKALKVSNWEAVFSTVHITLTGGAFQTGFALMLGASNFWMGVLSSFPTLAGLFQILSAYFIERRGERKRFTAFFSGAGRLLWLPILLLPFLLPSQARFSGFLLLLLISSILLSISSPAFTSWMSDLVPPDQRGRYFGRRNMLAGLTTIAVSLPAAWFLDLAVKRHLFPPAVGFSALFGFAVVCGIGSYLCLLKQAEPPMQRMERGGEGGLRSMLLFYRAPFGDPNFRRLMLFSSFFTAAQFFAAPFYLVYALKVLKLNYAWLQVFATIASLASLLSMPLWGYLSDKFGNRALLAIACFGTGLTPLLWLLTSPQKPTATLISLAVNNLLGGMFWAGVNLTQFNLIIAITPNERKSVYVGAFSAVAGLAGGLAPIVGGIILTALHDVHVLAFGVAFGAYKLLFLINAAMRFIALPFLGRVADTLPTTAQDVLTQLGAGRVGAFVNIRRMQRAQTEEARREALQALRSARTSLAVEELIAALDDPSLSVREEAAETLGEIGDPRAADALIAHLEDSASGIVDEAATSLGRIGDMRAVPPLINLLHMGEKLDRVAAARALGRIGDPRAVPALKEIIDSDDSVRNPEVAEACSGALGAIGDPVAVPSLIALLPRKARTLRIAVIRALGDIGHPSAEPPLLALLPSEEDQAIIAYAAVALAMVGAEDSIPALLEALDRVDSPVARRQMLNAIGSLMGEAQTFYPLLAQEPYARDQAVSRIIGEMARRAGDAPRGSSGIRSKCHFDEVQEAYVSEDYRSAVRGLCRLAGEVEDPVTANVLSWAERTAERRSMLSEEFLLALLAVRRAMQA